MGKKKITIEAEDGVSMTVAEVVSALAELPGGSKPRVFIKINGEIKRIEVES